MKSLNILLVDDDPTALLVLEKGLSLREYPVTTAADGEEALRRIAGECFDVVITDLMMPGIDGIGVLQAVKARSARTEVLLLTASQSLRSAVEAMKNGASDYLQKPVDLGELLIILEKMESFRNMAATAEELREAMDVTEHNAQETISRLEIEVARLASLLEQIREILSDETLDADERIDKVLHDGDERKEG
jgi:DNA-binding NtrC family response regulator